MGFFAENIMKKVDIKNLLNGRLKYKKSNND